MSPSPLNYLKHIRDELRFLQQESSIHTKMSFTEDERSKRACVRSLEIIGEAVKQLPAELTGAHPQVDWKAIARMRDKLIHHYFGVDYFLVWDIIEHQVPALSKTVDTLLEAQ